MKDSTEHLKYLIDSFLVLDEQIITHFNEHFSPSMTKDDIIKRWPQSIVTETVFEL